jgi:hypothetical protein
MKQFNLETRAWEEQEEKTPSALALLQSVYKDEGQPLSVRMRAAKEALPFETPKLAVTGYVQDDASFAVALERAIARSREGKVTLELSANADAGEGAADGGG